MKTIRKFYFLPGSILNMDENVENCIRKTNLHIAPLESISNVSSCSIELVEKCQQSLCKKFWILVASGNLKFLAEWLLILGQPILYFFFQMNKSWFRNLFILSQVIDIESNCAQKSVSIITNWHLSAGLCRINIFLNVSMTLS